MTAPIRVCVIGAGPSGIAAAKNCVQAGVDVTVFEKNTKVGGNWVFNASTGHSSVYENTHIISSKTWSEYEDFPMPASYPDYPHHSQLQAYFESYARHFGVMPRIRFGHTVSHVGRLDNGQWTIDFTDDQGNAHTEHYTHLMVANGHHWNPKHPEYPGTFSGQYMHSHDFKGIDDTWRGKRVLVIGAGNSACDVAVESARLAGKVCISMRSPQWFIPKFIFGKPADVFAAGTAWLPVWFRMHSFKKLMHMLQGSYADMGLPVNHKSPLTQHPTLNSDFIDFVRHGRIHPRAGIARYEGSSVVFTDGRREEFDTIVACTGFWISFPFFDKDFIDFQHAEKTPLYRKMMHQDYPNLYFIGLFQPLGCVWPLADMQARLAVQEMLGMYQRPADIQAAIAYEMAHPHYPFERAARHSTEVDYHAFRAELGAELAKAGIDIGKPPALRKPGVLRPTLLPA
jgi:Flavin-binding monooxygenase-like